jgi:hypothetical protein
LKNLLCIYSALYWNARPFFENFSNYKRLQSYFEDYNNSGSPIICGDCHNAFNNLKERIVDLMLGCYVLPDTLKWRESLKLTGEMTGVIDTVKLPCPPHYNGRRAMPIAPFHSFDESFNKVFAPQQKTESFNPVSSQHNRKSPKPFIKQKGIAIANYKPEKYGYFMMRIDYTFGYCKGSCWDFYIHSKPGQTFVDFVIELSEIYESLKRCRKKNNRYLMPVYENDKDSPYCSHFYIKSNENRTNSRRRS